MTDRQKTHSSRFPRRYYLFLKFETGFHFVTRLECPGMIIAHGSLELQVSRGLPSQSPESLELQAWATIVQLVLIFYFISIKTSLLLIPSYIHLDIYGIHSAFVAEVGRIDLGILLVGPGYFLSFRLLIRNYLTLCFDNSLINSIA